jgi:hypothetical protein
MATLGGFLTRPLGGPSVGVRANLCRGVGTAVIPIPLEVSSFIRDLQVACSLLRFPCMKTTLRAPHFLRVTQALAFVSGLGLPLVGCGGETPQDPGEGGLHQGVPMGTQPAPECMGVCVLPDASSGASDAGQVPDVLLGIGLAPDASDDGDARHVFSGIGPAPEAGEE